MRHVTLMLTELHYFKNSNNIVYHYMDKNARPSCPGHVARERHYSAREYVDPAICKKIHDGMVQ